MARRKKSRKGSRSSYRKGLKVKRKNTSRRPMRGGFRI